MREDLADKAEIHAFRGVSGCQAKSFTSLRIKHGGSQGSSASGFGSQDQASSRAKHDIVGAC